MGEIQDILEIFYTEEDFFETIQEIAEESDNEYLRKDANYIVQYYDNDEDDNGWLNITYNAWININSTSFVYSKD